MVKRLPKFNKSADGTNAMSPEVFLKVEKNGQKLQCNQSADGTDGSRGGRHSWLDSETSLHPTFCCAACHHLGKGAISLQLQEVTQYYGPIWLEFAQ